MSVVNEKFLEVNVCPAVSSVGLDPRGLCRRSLLRTTCWLAISTSFTHAPRVLDDKHKQP